VASPEPVVRPFNVITTPVPGTAAFPLPRRGRVSRRHLVQKIEEGTRRRLTLIIAPAGWGKSSLLAEWLDQTRRPVIWLPLEAADNEPSRLLRLVGQAVDATFPGLAADTLAITRSVYPPEPGSLFASLSGALQEISTPFTLVLDDVHHLTDPGIRHALQNLIATMPATASTVLSSRAEPSLSIARWRAQGEVTEMRLDDLRFSLEEAHGLLATQAELHVDRDSIATILERTEGWAAGLHLAGLLVRGQPADGVARIVDLQGTQREVAAFLCEEVLDRQPDAMRQFLMQAAILDPLSAALCNAALQIDNAAMFLERATADGLFIIPVDTSGQVFRMHPLFRDYLRAELRRTFPGQESLLHRRAATWLIDTGNAADAIDHLLLAGEVEQAASQIEAICDATIVTSEMTNRFIAWTESLPESTIIDHPRIMLSLTQALIGTGQLTAAESMVQTMMAHSWFAGDAVSPEISQRQGELSAVRSRLAAYRGDDRQTLVLANVALELFGTNDPTKRAGLELDLGFANRSIGNLNKAATHFANASRLGWETGSLQPALWGARYLALVWLAQGRLREAIALIDADLERVRDSGVDGHSIHAALLITRGELCFEHYDLAGARDALETGLDLARRTSDAKILMNGYVALAMIEMAEGHPDAALLMLRRGMRIFNGAQEAALQAAVALAAGQLAAARQWAESSGLSTADSLLPDRGPAEQLVFARVLLANGETGAAIPFLQRLLDAVTSRGWHGRAIELQVVLAGALLGTGNTASARDMLRAAIRTAEPEGIVRPLVQAGPDLAGLLRDVLRSRDSGIGRDFATRLIELVGGTARNPDTASGEQNGLPESLTGRQLDVLRLLAAGHTNREIAAALFLAEGTVKAHVYQICAKLMVRNRTEAVARARELGLIP